jgi:hypothetical protein
MVKTILFLPYNFHSIIQMTRQNGGITRSTNNKATARRLRDEMIFWKAIAQIHNEASLAAIRSYFLEMIANK